MEKYKYSALCLVMATCLSGNALAAAVPGDIPTGTLAITGVILEKGCTINAQNFTIQLAPVQASKFTAAGDMGPKSEAVPLQLTGCPTSSSLNFKISGTLSGTALNKFKNTASTDAATGLSTILYVGGTPMGTSVGKTITTDSSGNYSTTLVGQVIADSATVGVGAIESNITYTLAYN